MIAKLLGAAFIAVSLLWVSPAPADGPPRIVVLVDPSATALARRMAAELGTMGFSAEVIAERSGADVSADLARVATRERAVAGVRAVESGGVLRMWVVDRATGKALVREVASGKKTRERTLAIVAVELLRASLLELGLPDAPSGDVPATPSLLQAAGVPAPARPSAAAPRPPSSPAAPGAAAARPGHEAPAVATSPPSVTARRGASGPPRSGDAATAKSLARRVGPIAGEAVASARPIASTRPWISLEVGAGLSGSLGDLPPFAVLAASAGIFVTPRVRVDVTALFPAGAMTHAADEGKSQTRVSVFGLGARADLLDGVWRPSFGGGATVSEFSTEGQGRAPFFRGSSASTQSAGLYVVPGFAYAPAPQLRLRADVFVGTQFRPFALDYAGREAARWGAPWQAGTFGIEAILP